MRVRLSTYFYMYNSNYSLHVRLPFMHMGREHYFWTHIK